MRGIKATIFVVVLVAVTLVSGTTARAINECGTATAGATVVCDGSGTPASNSSPYGLIQYNIPVHLVVDGSVNPLAVNGLVRINGNGETSLQTLGAVTVNQSGNLGTAGMGDYSTNRYRPLSINLSGGTTYTGTRTTANGQYYAVSAGTANRPALITSAASITSTHAGGGGPWHGAIIARDWVGGTQSRVEIHSTGQVTTTTTHGNNASTWGIFAGSAASPLPVIITSSAPVTVGTTTGGQMEAYAIYAYNSAGTGGTRVTQHAPVTLTGNWLGLSSGAWGSVGVMASSPAHNEVYVHDTVHVDVTGIARGVESMNGAVTTIVIDGDVTALGGAGLEGTGVGVGNDDNSETVAYTLEVKSGRTIEASRDAVAIHATDSGTVTLEDGVTLRTTDAAGGAALISHNQSDDTIVSAADIEGDIMLGDGDDSLTLNGGSIAGAIYMGDGDDTVSITGDVDISGLSAIDGGGGNSQLVLDGAAAAAFSTLGSGIQITGFSQIIVQDGAELSLSGDLVALGGAITVTEGSVIGVGSATGTFTLDGDVASSGVISLQQGAPHVGDQLLITGGFIGGGTLRLDALLGEPAVADTLHIAGDVAAGQPTVISLRNLGGSGAATTGKGILLVRVDGESPADAFVLEGGYVDAGQYRYTLVHDDDGNWYLRSVYVSVPGAPSTGVAPGSSAPLLALFMVGASLVTAAVLYRRNVR